MSTLKTHNLQSPDAASVNIALAPNAGMVVTGISTFSATVKIGSSVPDAESLAEDLVALLARGGFTVKAPPPTLTKDGVSVTVFGNKWFPEDDVIGIPFGPLNFAKKSRGKRGSCPGDVPEKLTKRICLGKAHELFDICGLVAPLMCTLKLDLSDLFKMYEGWNTPISDVEREKWIKHFQLLVEVGELRFSRVVIPEGAVDLNVELLGAGDASQRMTCAACYVRF